MRFRYDGNYCGPGWSGGRWQNSIKGRKGTAVGALDETCRQHDWAYSDGKDLNKADYKFFNQNSGKGIKRSLAAWGVLSNVPRRFLFPEKKSEMVPTRNRSRGRPLKRSRPVTPSRSRSAPRARSLPNRNAFKVMAAKMAPRRRRPGKFQGVAAGFVKKARKIRDPLTKFSNRGVTYTTEGSGALTATYCQFIGHATCPVAVMVNSIFKSIVRALLIKAGMVRQDPFEYLFINAGDQFILTYRLDEEVATTNSTITLTVATNYSFVTLSEYFYSAVISIGGIDTQNFQFVSFEYLPSLVSRGNYCRINLLTASVEYYIKSSLKLQNRTHNASNNEADDVDNTPLNGKYYEGSGNGTQWAAGTSGITPFITSDSTGVIAKASSDYQFKEPPPKNLFKNVKKYDKVRINPGELKTSVLTYKRTHSLNKLTGMLSFNNAVYDLTPMGKFRFFALEKMISITGEASISTVYEHNFCYGVMLKTKTDNKMVMVNDIANV